MSEEKEHTAFVVGGRYSRPLFPDRASGKASKQIYGLMVGASQNLNTGRWEGVIWTPEYGNQQVIYGDTTLDQWTLEAEMVTMEWLKATQETLLRLQSELAAFRGQALGEVSAQTDLAAMASRGRRVNNGSARDV